LFVENLGNICSLNHPVGNSGIFGAIIQRMDNEKKYPTTTGGHVAIPGEAHRMNLNEPAPAHPDLDALARLPELPGVVYLGHTEDGTRFYVGLQRPHSRWGGGRKVEED
jgi:hypothetical protein